MSKQIKLVVTDVDGVFTDGYLFFGPEGETIKKFHARDGLAVQLLQKNGIEVAVLSGRQSIPVLRRMEELSVQCIDLGNYDRKINRFHKIIKERGYTEKEVAFIGDDISDLEVLKIAGLSGAPSDAAPEVLQQVDFISKKKGGEGAFREFAEHILKSMDLWNY